MSNTVQLENATIRFYTVPASAHIGIDINGKRAAYFVPSRNGNHSWQIQTTEAQIIKQEQTAILATWLAQHGFRQPESAAKLVQACLGFAQQRREAFAA